MKNSQILALILLSTASHWVDASNQQPAELYQTEHEKMHHKNWYGTCSPKKCPNPFDDLMFENDQIQLHGGSCQEWLNHKNKYDRTLLHQAINENNIRRVEKLIELGADVNQYNKYGRTLLHYIAAWYNNNGDNYETAQLLIANGADVDQQDKNGHTPLYMAVESHKHKIIQLLITAGAEVNRQDVMDSTPLHWAVKFNNHETIQLLLIAGADTTIKNRNGLTARKLARSYETHMIFDEANQATTEQNNSCCSLS